MKENGKIFLLYINIDYQCLSINVQSGNNTGRVGKILQTFPRIPRFRFQVYGQKRKRGIGGKVFISCVFASQISLTSTKCSKGLLKFLKYTCLLYNLVRICFYLKKGSNYSYFQMKENGKMFLRYINIKSKCLNINI